MNCCPRIISSWSRRQTRVAVAASSHFLQYVQQPLSRSVLGTTSLPLHPRCSRYPSHPRYISTLSNNGDGENNDNNTKLGKVNDNNTSITHTPEILLVPDFTVDIDMTVSQDEYIKDSDGSDPRIAVSPDGKRIYAAIYRHVGVYSAETGECLGWLDNQGYLEEMNDETMRGLVANNGHGMKGHLGWIDAMVLSPCGKFLVTAAVECVSHYYHSSFERDTPVSEYDMNNRMKFAQVFVWNTESMSMEHEIIPPFEDRKIQVSDIYDDMLLMHVALHFETDPQGNSQQVGSPEFAVFKLGHDSRMLYHVSIPGIAYVLSSRFLSRNLVVVMVSSEDEIKGDALCVFNMVTGELVQTLDLKTLNRKLPFVVQCIASFDVCREQDTLVALTVHTSADEQYLVLWNATGSGDILRFTEIDVLTKEIYAGHNKWVAYVGGKEYEDEDPWHVEMWSLRDLKPCVHLNGEIFLPIKDVRMSPDASTVICTRETGMIGVWKL